MFQPGLSLGQIVRAVTRLLIGRSGRSRESETNSITTNRNSVQSLAAAVALYSPVYDTSRLTRGYYWQDPPRPYPVLGHLLVNNQQTVFGKLLPYIKCISRPHRSRPSELQSKRYFI